MKQHRVVGKFVLHSLIQREGIWHARARDTETGRMRWHSTRETVRRKAEQAALAWVARLQKEADSGMVAITFRDAYREWLTTKADLRPITLEDYQRNGQAVYGDSFGARAVGSIQFADVEAWLATMRRRGQSPRTRYRHLVMLRSFFRWCVNRKYTRENPCLGVRIARSDKSPGVALTTEQARALLAASRPCLRLMLLLSLHTGLRRSNVRELTWSEVDLKARTISIPPEKMKGRRALTIPIHPELVEMLDYVRGTPEDLVLQRHIMRPDRGFHGALKRAGLPHMRFHDLRHTFATWVGVRAPHVILKALLGHSARDVTGIYPHPSIEDMRPFVDSLPRLLEEEPVRLLPGGPGSTEAPAPTEPAERASPAPRP